MAKFDTDLSRYFTDAEAIQSLFRRLLKQKRLSKRLLIVHGVAGVGKSALLQMFGLACEKSQVPTGFASCDQARDIVGLLSAWRKDLSDDKIELKRLSKALNRWNDLDAKLHAKDPSLRSQFFSGAAKGVIAATTSLVPVAGPLLSALGSMSVEALKHRLENTIPDRDDIDFYLDPSTTLTQELAADLRATERKRRIVLFLDAYEYIRGLDAWVCIFAQELDKAGANVLLVIAGREEPNWGSVWKTWRKVAASRELPELGQGDTLSLIDSFFRAVDRKPLGGDQAQAIARFARGLPLLAMIAMEVYIKNEDAGRTFPEIELMALDAARHRLLQDLETGQPLLHAAAVLRGFTKDILRAVHDIDRAVFDEHYDKLVSLRFVRTVGSVRSLHDSVREIIIDSLRMDDLDTFRRLQKRALACFNERLKTCNPEDRANIEAGIVYHEVCLDEAHGIAIFQQLAETATRLRMVNRLSELLSIVNSIRLRSLKSQGWRAYYGARLVHLNGGLREAETQYSLIVQERGYGDTKLRAYALCDLGGLLGNPGRVHEVDGLKRAKEAADESLAIGDPKDAKLNENHVNLGRAYARTAHDKEAVECYMRALRAATAARDHLAEVVIWSHIRGVHVYTGDWPAMLAADREARQLFPVGSEESSAMRDHLSGWAIGWAWAGRYKETEERIREARRIQKTAELGGGEFAGGGRDLGFAMAMQERYDEATKQLEQTIARDGRRLGRRAEAVALGFLGAALLRKGELDDAGDRLRCALAIKQEIGATQDIPEVLVWLGQLAETRGDRDGLKVHNETALELYENVRSLRHHTSRRYFQCHALAGIARTKVRLGGVSRAGELREIEEAESLATQYEHNDCMAALRLTQGDIAWTDSDAGSSFANVQRLFREAIIFALRFNRFALDEALVGRGDRGTFLHPISEQCREHGKEGARMLDELSAWWQTGRNEIVAEKIPTVSPIRHGISLQDAEREARAQEPGDGSHQDTVLEKLHSLRTGTGG